MDPLMGTAGVGLNILCIAPGNLSLLGMHPLRVWLIHMPEQMPLTQRAVGLACQKGFIFTLNHSLQQDT